MKVSIYQFDKNDEFIKRIEAESANISSFEWSLKNVKIIDNNGNVLSEGVENLSYNSIYDLDKIKSELVRIQK